MNLSYFNNLVDQKILSVSTIYLARVLSHEANADSCNIQPLSLIKAVGGEEKKQAMIPNVPISQSVLGALGTGRTLKGVVAIVASCERDTNQTRKNVFALPSIRHHSKSDSIVIGCLTENKNTGENSSHSHDNLYVLDGITEDDIKNLRYNTQLRHSHNNYATLNGIAPSDIINWNGAVGAVAELQKFDHVGQFWRDADGNIMGEIFGDYENNAASALFSASFGEKTTANGESQFVVGRLNYAPLDYDGTSPYAFIVGVGFYQDDGTEFRRNGLTVDWDGNVDVMKTLSAYRITTGSGGIESGIGSTATDQSYTFGQRCEADGYGSIASGLLTVVDSNGGTGYAFGERLTAYNRQFVIGRYNKPYETTSGHNYNTYAFIVGNGNPDTQSNALTLKYSGWLDVAYDYTITDADGIRVASLRDAASTIAENAALTASTLGMQKKNLLKNTASTVTTNGVTFTVNDDGSITVNGTATDTAFFNIPYNHTGEERAVILSGCPKGGNGDTYMFRADKAGAIVARDYGSGTTMTAEDVATVTYVAIRINAGYTAENLVFYPMIRYADVADSTYEPYTDDLQTQIKTLETRIAELETKLAALSS